MFKLYQSPKRSQSQTEKQSLIGNRQKRALTLITSSSFRMPLNSREEIIIHSVKGQCKKDGSAFSSVYINQKIRKSKPSMKIQHFYQCPTFTNYNYEKSILYPKNQTYKLFQQKKAEESLLQKKQLLVERLKLMKKESKVGNKLFQVTFCHEPKQVATHQLPRTYINKPLTPIQKFKFNSKHNLTEPQALNFMNVVIATRLNRVLDRRVATPATRTIVKNVERVRTCPIVIETQTKRSMLTSWERHDS